MSSKNPWYYIWYRGHRNEKGMSAPCIQVTHTQLRTETFAGTFFVHSLCFETGSHCVRPGWPGTCYLSQAGQPMNECRECAVHIRKYLF